MDSNLPKLDVKVLYVDDDDNIREAIVKLLDKKVASLYEATDGADGLDKFRKFQPDIVISDIKMPIMSGLEMAKEIKAVSQDTPVILTTAFTDTDNFMRAIELGVDRFVLKPLNCEKLFSIIEELHNQNRSKKELKKKNRLLEEYQRAIDVAAIVCKIDLQGNITYVNEQFCNISGYTKEELIGKSHNITKHPDTKKELLKEMWLTINSKKTWSGTIQNMSKTGETYHIDLKVIPILDEKNEIGEFISITHDISEIVAQSKEIERMRLEQIKESIEKASDIRIHTIIHNIPIPTIIIDNENRILDVNQKFEKLLDFYKDSAILGKLKSKKLKITDIFINEDGYIYDDPLIDWKDIVAKLGDEDEYMAKLDISSEESIFHIGVKKVEKLGEEDRYIVCLSHV